MKLFLCSHFSSVGSLIKEEIENKKVAFIPTASLREGYTGYVGSIGTTAGALLGSSTITTYVESASGVAEGISRFLVSRVVTAPTSNCLRFSAIS